MAESKSAALPLGYAPMLTGIADGGPPLGAAVSAGRTIAIHPRRINLAMPARLRNQQQAANSAVFALSAQVA
jgi:hypothetical protein